MTGLVVGDYKPSVASRRIMTRHVPDELFDALMAIIKEMLEAAKRIGKEQK